MEQAGKRNLWPWALAGLVVVLLGCGLVTLVFGGAAGWMAFSSLDSGSGNPTPPAAVDAPVLPAATVASAPAVATVAEASAPADATGLPATSPPATSPGETTSYVHAHGWAVDLDSQWRVEYDEAQGETNLYNYPADTPGSGSFDPGMTRIRVVPQGSSGTLDSLVATLPTEIQQFEDVFPLLSEERWSLPGGLEAVRRDFGVQQELVFVLDGRGYVATGMGEKAPFDEAMRTLRPAPGGQSAAPASRPATDGGTVGSAPPCSPRDAQAEVEIRIENKGVFTVDIQWIDHDCRPVEVATLAPDQVIEQQTTVGHVFTAGGHGWDHGTYVVPASGGTWTITGPTESQGGD